MKGREGRRERWGAEEKLKEIKISEEKKEKEGRKRNLLTIPKTLTTTEKSGLTFFLKKTRKYC